MSVHKLIRLSVTIHMAQKICEPAGIHIECRDHSVQDTSVAPRASTNVHTLERRSDWGFVCDGVAISQEYQRYFTTSCQKQGYSCDKVGRMKTTRRDYTCNLNCRCVRVNANCFIQHEQPTDSWWYVICGGTRQSVEETSHQQIESSTNDGLSESANDTEDQPVEATFEKRDAATSESSVHTLERRHDYAFVCDDARGRPENQRSVTVNCVAGGCGCTQTGRMAGRGWNYYCDQYCRCVNVRPNCRPTLHKSGGVRYWTGFCPISSEATDEQDQSVNESLEKRSVLSISSNTEAAPGGRAAAEPAIRSKPDVHFIERQDQSNTWGSWKVWCSDADSMRDALLGGNCQDLWKYRCDGQGELTKPEPIEDCEAACACIREPIAPPMELRSIAVEETASSENSVESLVEREPDRVPGMNPWALWCSDEDSINDSGVDGKCGSDLHYSCSADGTITRPTPDDTCELACACIQTPKGTPPRDASTDVVKREPDTDHMAEPEASNDVVEREDQSWTLWCSDKDSIHDAQVDWWCTTSMGYSCDKEGKFVMPSEVEQCTNYCACVEAPYEFKPPRIRSRESDESAGNLKKPCPPHDITYDSPFEYSNCVPGEGKRDVDFNGEEDST